MKAEEIMLEIHKEVHNIQKNLLLFTPVKAEQFDAIDGVCKRLTEIEEKQIHELGEAFK